MGIVLSLGYLVFGVLIANRFDQVKYILSKMLAKLFIPLVIIYNILYYNKDYLILMIFSLCASFLLFFIYIRFKKDSLKALCFSYSNIGWLGVPIASSMFGGQASAVMISLYIGSSIFGNSFASIALGNEKLSSLKNIVGVLRSPPILAIFIAILMKNLQLMSFFSENTIQNLYFISKIGMTFCGMCVLGMWLRHATYSKQDFIENFYASFYKMILGMVLVFILGYTFRTAPIIASHIDVIFLIFLLPPAANIVALETAYRKTGASVNYIGASTITSLVYISIYYLLLKCFGSI